MNPRPFYFSANGNVPDTQSLVFVDAEVATDQWYSPKVDFVLIVDISKDETPYTVYPKGTVSKGGYLDISDGRVKRIVARRILGLLDGVKRHNPSWTPKVLLRGTRQFEFEDAFEIDMYDMIDHVNHIVDFLHGSKTFVIVEDPLTDMNRDGSFYYEGITLQTLECGMMLETLTKPLFIVETYRNWLHAILGRFFCQRFKSKNVFITGHNPKSGVNYFNL